MSTYKLVPTISCSHLIKPEQIALMYYELLLVAVQEFPGAPVALIVSNIEDTIIPELAKRGIELVKIEMP